MYQQPNWAQLSQVGAICPKCNGEMIAAKVPGFGAASAHLVPLDSMFGMRWSGLTANVCRNCGFVEFYAEKPEELESDAGPADVPFTNR